MSGSAAPSVAAKFGALRHRDYRRYFLVALLGMTAESVEHVGSYWVIFQSFHSPTLGGFAVISHWVGSAAAWWASSTRRCSGSGRAAG